MTDIPRSVLSEHFQELMKGKVLRNGIFLTFKFDPGFFEQEILPVFLDIPLSHEPAVRLIQLEDAIREHIDHLAVYYDQAGLEAGATGAQLDIRRIPIAWPTGFFHPKNVILLVEDAEADEEGNREQALIVAAMSANLTRAGWWESVEVCHAEQVKLDGKSSLRSDLLKLFSRVRSASPDNEGHAALEAIRRFVVKVPERLQRTWEGVLHPRLYVGVRDDSEARESVPDFLERLLQNIDLNLEIISPYFDAAGEVGPLKELMKRFSLKEVRVFLPTGPDGKALCRASVYDAVRKLPNTRWAKLPGDLLKGAAESAAPRRVHAKVYRFFSPSRRYEALFVGSVNLTTAAHAGGGNFETAFLIEPEPKGGPDWWLAADSMRPAEFQGVEEDEGLIRELGSALLIRYDWGSARASAFWNNEVPAPRLELAAQGSTLFSLADLPSRTWVTLKSDATASLERILKSTSLLSVLIAGHEPATILVLEEGMARKPSILLNLTVAEILRCWAALAPEHKAVLLEERYLELTSSMSALLPRNPLGQLEQQTMFSAFAGIFQAFNNLERNVLKALEKKREKEAEYILFGKKYDSLPRLIDRVIDEEKELDTVNRYVMALCARQLLVCVKEKVPAFFATYKGQAQELEQRLGQADRLRESFSFGTPESRGAFLDWFEKWFLRRAESIQVTPR